MAEVQGPSLVQLGSTPQNEDQGNIGYTLHLTGQGALFNLPSCPAILQRADPLKVYPQLKGSFPENLKHLKNTMEGLEWKVSRSPCTGALFSCLLWQGWEDGGEGWARGAILRKLEASQNLQSHTHGKVLGVEELRQPNPVGL